MNNMSSKRILMFLFLFGLFGLTGCYDCLRWEKRTAYRQACQRWSGGVCAFYKTEAYEENVCVEWPDRQPSGTVISSKTEHTNDVQDVAFSPDGRFALSGYRNKILRLSDVKTGKEIRSFAGHTDGVYSVAFSPDGKFALSGSGDTPRIWDINTGREIVKFIGFTDGK